MNVFRVMGITVAMMGSLAVTQAQTIPTLSVVSSGATQKHGMIVTLGYSTVQTVAAMPCPPPVNLNPGSALTLRIGYNEWDFLSVSWIKNNRPLGRTVSEMTLTNLAESDSGYYQAIIHRIAGDITTDVATIRVGFAARQSLRNLTTRATIGPANPVVICGFVVTPSPGSLHESKALLVRAIGPALAKFGVDHPLATPVLKIFRSDGTAVDLRAESILLGGTTESIAGRIGAYPLPAVSSDIAVLISLPAGIYTGQISSGVVGGSGDVLFEIYEVPDRALDYGINFPS